MSILTPTEKRAIFCSMFDMRFRLRELLAKKGITTAYGLHKAALNHLSMTTCYRLMDTERELVGLELDTIAVLCDLLEVTPDKLLDHKPKKLTPKEAA